MILHHFTVERYVDSIREHGVLSIAEKKRRGMYPRGWRPAPPMWKTENETVWLTDDPDANAGIQRIGEQVYRVTVEVDDAERWFAYAARKHLPGYVRMTYRKAALALSPTNRDVNWYVLEKTVPASAIIAIQPVEVGGGEGEGVSYTQKSTG